MSTTRKLSIAFIDRMKAQDYIDNTRRYLDYLEEHIENVRLAFDEVSTAEQYYNANKDKISLNEDHLLLMFEIFEKLKDYREAG